MALHLVTGYKGTAHITPEDVGAFNAGIMGSDEYVMSTGNKFAASIISNNTVKILDGDAIMQGRHVTLKSGTFEELTINNGEIGKNRTDLIVIRYTKDAITGTESASFAVIQGTATTGAATDPEHTTGDLLSGNCLLHEMPLYKVSLTGLMVGEPVKLFKEPVALSELFKIGSYVGDEQPSQFIDVGFTPSAVFVIRNDGFVSNSPDDYYFYYYGGMALKDKPCSYWSNSDNFIVEITEGGFNVFCESIEINRRWHYILSNGSSNYYYIAFR